MMKLLIFLIRAIFLVKEIVSKEGQAHFRRYRLASTPWFNIYIHQIMQSDKDKDPHDHPWDFASLIISGAYREVCSYAPEFETRYLQHYFKGDVIEHKAEDCHKLLLLTPVVWTLVITSGRGREWGYQTDDGWVHHQEYRDLKNKTNDF